MIHGLKIKMYAMFQSVILQTEFYVHLKTHDSVYIDIKPQALEILSIDR